jgi:hypothetical protein
MAEFQILMMGDAEFFPLDSYADSTASPLDEVIKIAHIWCE